MRLAREYFDRVAVTAQEFRRATTGSFFAFGVNVEGFFESECSQGEDEDAAANEQIGALLTRIIAIATRRASVLRAEVERVALDTTWAEAPTEPGRR